MSGGSQFYRSPSIRRFHLQRVDLCPSESISYTSTSRCLIIRVIGLDWWWNLTLEKHLVSVKDFFKPSFHLWMHQEKSWWVLQGSGARLTANRWSGHTAQLKLHASFKYFFCGNLIQNCEALGTKSQCSLVVRHVSLPLRQEQRRWAASRRRLVCGSLARQAACAVQRCARWVFHLADADPGTAEQHSVYRWELVWSPRHEAKWWNDACHGCSKSICKELLVSGSSAEHRLVLQKPLSLTAVTRLYIVWQYLPRIIPKYIVTLDVLFI